MVLKFKVLASKTTPTTDKVSETSYLIIWAELRSLPINGYLLFDDQPASATPYTPIEVMAKTNINPMPVLETTKIGTPIQVRLGGPKGISAMVVRPRARARNGARM